MYNAAKLEAAKDITFILSNKMAKSLFDYYGFTTQYGQATQLAVPFIATVMATPFSNAISLLVGNKIPDRDRQFLTCLKKVFENGTAFKNLEKRVGTTAFFRMLNNVVHGTV